VTVCAATPTRPIGRSCRNRPVRRRRISAGGGTRTIRGSRGGRSSVAGMPNWCRLRIAGRRIATCIGRFRSRGRRGSQNCSDAARDGAAAAVEPWVRTLQPLCPHDPPGVGGDVRLLAGGRGVVAEVRMTARFIVGDVFDGLATLEDGSVDLVVTSPPFLALRSYLPADHPDKDKEIGSEATPAAFIDVMLAVTAELRRVLAPHGSICIELGDTYAGSGGAGGDYGEGGLREGQLKFSG